jgi:hypothetical protein
MVAQLLCDYASGERTHHHWGKRGNRIAPDHELECIKGACERRVERGRNAARGSATDEDAKVVAPHAQHVAERGRHPAAHLRISGLKPHRSAVTA